MFRKVSWGQGQADFPLSVYGTLKSREQRSANVKITVLKRPLGYFLLG